MAELNLEDLRNKCLTSLYSCTGNISKYITKSDTKSTLYKQLRDCVKEYCKMEQQEEASRKALLAVQNESENIDSDSLQTKYQEEFARSSKSKSKFSKHRFVTDLEEYIKNAERSAGTVVEDDDLAITETQDKYIDPIGKRPIMNPVRNTICNHVYEKETIEDFIKNKKNRGCFYLGCNNKQSMQMQHFRPDEALRQRILSALESEDPLAEC